MREIEVKAKVNDLTLLLEKANDLGIKFGRPIFQDDSTYETKISKTDPAWNIFRIRKQENQIILTMKYLASNRSRDNHERESIIDNDKAVIDMLERVGYKFGVRIMKKRRKAKYQGLEICLDEIEDLGNFIEIEKLADDNADVDLIQSELWEILLKMGIKPEDRIHQGYDTLMKKFVNNN